jgi:hypothetical protein
MLSDALHRKFETNIPKNETARPRSQFLHSCVCEQFIHSHDRSAYFGALRLWTDRGNIYIAHRYMYVDIGYKAEKNSFVSGNIGLKIFGTVHLQCVISAEFRDKRAVAVPLNIFIEKTVTNINGVGCRDVAFTKNVHGAELCWRL